MYYRVYIMGSGKMYDSNNITARRGTMKVYYCKVCEMVYYMKVDRQVKEIFTVLKQPLEIKQIS